MRLVTVQHSSSTAFRGRIQHARFGESCDLVDEDEARARLGVSSTDDVLGHLAKRRRRSLAPGIETWLVDLGSLAEPLSDPASSLAHEGLLSVIETGDSL
jgi:hypothetical protein